MVGMEGHLNPYKEDGSSARKAGSVNKVKEDFSPATWR